MDMLGEGLLEDVRWLRPGVMADSQCTHISRLSEEQVALSAPGLLLIHATVWKMSV